MNFSRKLLSLITAAVIVFFAVPDVRAEAASSVQSYYYGDSSKYAKAEIYIAEQLYNTAEKIDVSKYKLKIHDFEEIMTDILLSRPDIFYVEPYYYYTSYKDSGYLISVTPSYYYAKSTISRRRSEMESEADTLLSGLNDKWSDVQKALYIHDKLIVSAEYNGDNDNRSAYEVLVKKNGLCVAYAMAYKYLLNRVGIECICVISSEMEHCWNMIRIGGSWYHVDATWDDLVPDFEGSVSHSLFLLSDEAITKSNIAHYDWEYGYKADNTSYDNMFWLLSEAQIIPVTSNQWYYIDSTRGTLNRYSWSKGTSQQLLRIGRDWSSESGEYFFCFSRLEYAEGKLWFNNKNSIMSYDIAEKTSAVEKTVSLKGSQAIYGLAVKDGKLIYEVATSVTDYSPVTKTAFELNVSTGLDAPESFRGVASKADGKYSVKLTWDKVDGADGYTVYKYDPIGKKAEKIADTSKTGYTVKGLSKGSYSYIVCAYKTINGNKIYGDYSSTVTKNLK